MENNTPVKRGRGRPTLSEQEKNDRALQRKQNLTPGKVNEKTSPGDNSRYLRHALATMGLPPIDIADPIQVDDRLNWYFNYCIDNDMKPTVNGMCNSLGIHRDTLHTWKTGEKRSGTHQEIIVKAYKLLEELWESYMLNGKINPLAGIYISKVMFGYSDQQEIIVTPGGYKIDASEIKQIEDKYAELPDDISR